MKDFNSELKFLDRFECSKASDDSCNEVLALNQIHAGIIDLNDGFRARGDMAVLGESARINAEMPERDLYILRTELQEAGLIEQTIRAQIGK